MNFNPRSLAGATSIFKSIAQAQVFQSTLPRGSDTIVLPIVPADLPLSIHAPSRERHKVYLLMHPTAHFNPRSLAGATLILIRFFVHFVISIHAPSRERLCLSPAARAKMDFNPRSLAGATHEVGNRVLIVAISIHAPSRERRQLTYTAVSQPEFQSTLPRGSD